MIERPTVDELLQALSSWLGNDDAPDAYARKLAQNAIGIVRREANLWPAAEAKAVRRLSGILGKEGDFRTLTAKLAEEIRAGRLSGFEPAVVQHLKQTAIDIIAIDQPNYRHSLKL